MRLNFVGKTVLITGSANGIGRELSRCFAEDGANVVLVDLPSEIDNLDTLAKELKSSYKIKAWTFGIDLTEFDKLDNLHRQVVDTVGNVYALVNNAGICWYQNFHDMPKDKLEKMLLLNCMAYAKLSRLFLPSMIENDEGAILNVSSVGAFQPLPRFAMYTATKAFTQILSESIFSELPHKSNIVVATLNPPFTKTALIKDAGIPEDFIPFSISYKPASVIAKLGFSALKKGKMLYVPGWQNKVLHLGLIRVLPRKLVLRIGNLICRGWSDFIKNQNKFGVR